MASLDQWQLPCLICGDPVEYHCNTCGDILCSKCKNYHLKSGASKHHHVVPYAERITPKTFGECGEHPGSKYHAWCQRCNKAVCNECICSLEHRGHVFQKLEEKVDERRKELQADLKQTENTLKKWEEFLEKVMENEKKHEQLLRQVETSMSKRASEIVTFIKQMESDNKTSLRSLARQSHHSFDSYKQQAKDAIGELRKNAALLDNKLRSDDASDLMKACGTKTKQEKTIFPTIKLQSYKFIPGILDQAALALMFGSVEFDNSKQAFQNPLIEKPRIVGEIRTAVKGPEITCTKAGDAWIKSKAGFFEKFDRDGNPKSSLYVHSRVYDVAMANNGDLLFTDPDQKYIVSVKNTNGKKSLEVLCQTTSTPGGICVLDNDDIAVAIMDDSTIMRFSKSGKFLNEIRHKSLAHPWFLTTDKEFRNLYVTSKHRNRVQSTGKVLCLSTDGTIVATYIGARESAFTPMCICSDQIGHILVTDIQNHKVHILSKSCQLLRYLFSSYYILNEPCVIDVDGSGHVWIGEYESKTVKIVQYMK